MSNSEQSERTPQIQALNEPSSSEFLTDSTDPEELRALLDRARERLSFYERFDRLISENVRHSGELMQEAIAMREQIAADLSASMRGERAHVAAGLEDLARRVAEIRSLVAEHTPEDDTGQHVPDTGAGGTESPARDDPETQFRTVDPLTLLVSSPDAERSDHAETNVDPQAGAQVTELAAGGAVASESGVVGSVETAPEAPGVATGTEPAPVPWPEPRTVDVIAQPVYQASTALALQQFVGELEPVVKVEAREFAGGILRLQVTSRRELTAGDLTDWGEGGTLEVRHAGPGLLHLGLDGNG